MTPPLNIDGSQVSAVTIDGQNVSQITIDGQEVLSAIPDSGVLRYAFEDDSDTTTAIDEWNNNNGTIDSGPTYSTTSKYGTYALDMASNEYVDIPIQSLSTPFSIAVWIQRQSSTTNERFWGNYNSTSSDLYLWDGGGTGVWNFFDDNGNNLSGGTLNTGSYKLIVVTRADNRSRLYENDTQVDEATGLSAATYDSGTNFHLNETPYVTNAPGADALYDNFDIYDKELTSTEVSNLYDTGSIGG